MHLFVVVVQDFILRESSLKLASHLAENSREIKILKGVLSDGKRAGTHGHKARLQCLGIVLEERITPLFSTAGTADLSPA